jgi:hypothetical protein
MLFTNFLPEDFFSCDLAIKVAVSGRQHGVLMCNCITVDSWPCPYILIIAILLDLDCWAVIPPMRSVRRLSRKRLVSDPP